MLRRIGKTCMRQQRRRIKHKTHYSRQRVMNKCFFPFLLLATFSLLHANDGAYYARGNQLIPITEREISVTKEILSLRKSGDYMLVDVYYEFLNPGKAKNVLVGFEAPPQGGAVPAPKGFPEHDYISDFSVLINGQQISYNIAHTFARLATTHVEDEEPDYKNAPEYYSNGHIQSLTPQECKAALDTLEYQLQMFNYVYYFNATFNPGVNIIRHTYKCRLSVSVEYSYLFSYVLTAANRWANNGIDDFTLNIDMGGGESFQIQPKFFGNADDWKINGRGRKNMATQYSWQVAQFHILDGSISFHATNFHPNGELEIAKPMMMSWIWSNVDYDKRTVSDWISAVKAQRYVLNYRHITNEHKISDFTSEQRQIMRNLPFAYHGYIFKTKSLQDFFKSTRWYEPDPKYEAKLEELTEEERDWVDFWSK